MGKSAQESAQDLINETTEAQDYIPKSSQKVTGMNKLQNMITRRKVQQIQSQNRRNAMIRGIRQGIKTTYSNTKLLVKSPIQGNFKQGYSLRRLPIAKRRMPGQPMIRQESVGTVTRFISNRAPPRSNSKGYSSRGRPKGTYKYYIPGVGPAGVFEWRKYQRLKQRQLAMQIQQQSPELSYPEARAALQQVQRQIPQPQPQVQQMPQVQTPMSPMSPQVMNQPSSYDDGWNLLRIKSPLSMIGNRVTPVDPIANTQAPIGNKYTAYYSEPDFISGKQVMKQRPNVGGFGLW